MLVLFTKELCSECQATKKALDDLSLKVEVLDGVWLMGGHGIPRKENGKVNVCLHAALVVARAEAHMREMWPLALPIAVLIKQGADFFDSPVLFGKEEILEAARNSAPV